MKKNITIILILFVANTFIYSQENKSFYKKLSDAAKFIIDPNIVYDPVYRKIAYPGGDVDKNRGVCTDVVIRAYRKIDIDLQKEVHEDMKANFSKYPSKVIWGLKSTDKNIDHRRVPNLQVFFGRKGETLTTSKAPIDYTA